MSGTPAEAGPVGLFGAGTIGAGWAATYLARRRPIVVIDLTDDIEERLLGYLRAAWPNVRRTVADVPDDVPEELVRFARPGEGALSDVTLVHESVPENVELKRSAYATLEREVGPEVPILSSSGGLSPTTLQAEMARPDRFVVAHPLTPVYALPLVEVLAGEATSAKVVEPIVGHLRQLDKRPVVLRREMPGYLTNRLSFALLREAVHCLMEGVADAQGVEDAVVYGITPRFLVEGPIISLALAGGPGGMTSAMSGFAPAIEQWWDDLGTPRLTEDVKEALIAAADAVLDGRTLAAVLAQRDQAVVDTVPRLRTIGGPEA